MVFLTVPKEEGNGNFAFKIYSKTYDYGKSTFLIYYFFESHTKTIINPLSVVFKDLIFPLHSYCFSHREYPIHSHSPRFNLKFNLQ